MGIQTWVETNITAQSSGSVVQSTTAFNTAGAFAQSLLNPQARFVYPPNYFYIGRSLRITVMGSLSNGSVAATRTVAFHHAMGPNSTIAVFATSANSLSSVATFSSVPFLLETFVTCRGISSQTTFIGQSRLMCGALTSGSGALTGGTPAFLTPNAQAATLNSFDCTLTTTLDLQAVTTDSTTGLVFGIQQYWVETLN